jgi:hypothetical protein
MTVKASRHAVIVGNAGCKGRGLFIPPANYMRCVAAASAR